MTKGSHVRWLLIYLRSAAQSTGAWRRQRRYITEMSVRETYLASPNELALRQWAWPGSRDVSVCLSTWVVHVGGSHVHSAARFFLVYVIVMLPFRDSTFSSSSAGASATVAAASPPPPPSVVRNDCSIPLCHWRVVCLPVRPNYYPGPTPLTGDSQSFLTSLSNIIHFSASAALTATQVATAYTVPFILSHFFALGIFCFIFYHRCSAVITATSLPIGKRNFDHL